jgi:hypothetical protein
LNTLPVMYIHAGSHKTGTTAIQHTLGAAADALRQQGICWPLLSPNPGHHKLVRAAFGRDPVARFQTRRLAYRVRRQSRGCGTTVLSCEKIYRIGYEFFASADQHTDENRRRRVAVLRKLRGLFAEHFDIRVILYLRRVDEFAESMYKELLFRKPYAGRFLFENFLREQRALFNYGDQVRELEECLGPVAVYSYHAARRTGLIEHFCSLIGASVPAEVRTDARIRRSASNAGALFLVRLAGQRDLSHADRLQVLDFCLSDVWPEPAGRRHSLWPSREVFEEFLRTHRTPGLEHLFPAVDADRLAFGPLDDEQYAQCLGAFERWRSAAA